jgi:hypothetical protein
MVGAETDDRFPVTGAKRLEKILGALALLSKVRLFGQVRRVDIRRSTLLSSRLRSATSGRKKGDRHLRVKIQVGTALPADQMRPARTPRCRDGIELDQAGRPRCSHISALRYYEPLEEVRTWPSSAD